jgi:hypothetical protein
VQLSTEGVELHLTGRGQRFQPFFCIVCQASIALCLRAGELMGHDVRTHMKHYGQWTDEPGLDAAFGAANAKLTASLTERQQQMQE